VTEGRKARRGLSSRERKVEVWEGGVCEDENGNENETENADGCVC
jgi:hypothetical protein